MHPGGLDIPCAKFGRRRAARRIARSRRFPHFPVLMHCAEFRRRVDETRNGWHPWHPRLEQTRNTCSDGSDDFCGGLCGSISQGWRNSRFSGKITRVWIWAEMLEFWCLRESSPGSVHAQCTLVVRHIRTIRSLQHGSDIKPLRSHFACAAPPAHRASPLCRSV